MVLAGSEKSDRYRCSTGNLRFAAFRFLLDRKIIPSIVEHFLHECCFFQDSSGKALGKTFVLYILNEFYETVRIQQAGQR